MNWENLRYFMVAAESGSLTAAARSLRSSAATLGRRIDALEADLGFRVLQRSPTGATVTDAGMRVLELARAGAMEIEQINRLARELGLGAANAPVLVSVTEPVAADVLAPRLPRLLEVDRSARVRLVVSIHNVDLNRREADLALRLAKPESESLLARRLPRIELGCFASPSYLAGHDAAALRLRDAALLTYDESYGEIPELKWLRKHNLEDRVVMGSSSTRALLEAAVAGVGVATLPRFLALQRGLVAVPAPAIPVRTPWLVFHRDLRTVRSVRTVRNWIVASCRDALG